MRSEALANVGALATDVAGAIVTKLAPVKATATELKSAVKAAGGAP
jgi:hypothetical protein